MRLRSLRPEFGTADLEHHEAFACQPDTFDRLCEVDGVLDGLGNDADHVGGIVGCKPRKIIGSGKLEFAADGHDFRQPDRNGIHD